MDIERQRWAAMRERLNLVLGIAEGEDRPWPIRAWDSDYEGTYFIAGSWHIEGEDSSKPKDLSVLSRLVLFMQPDIRTATVGGVNSDHHCGLCPSWDVEVHRDRGGRRIADPFEDARIELHHSVCRLCGANDYVGSGWEERGSSEFDRVLDACLGPDGAKFFMGIASAIGGDRPVAVAHWGKAALAGYGYGRWLGAEEYEQQLMESDECPAGCLIWQQSRRRLTEHLQWWRGALDSQYPEQRWNALLHQYRLEHGPDADPLPQPVQEAFRVRGLDPDAAATAIGRSRQLVRKVFRAQRPPSPDFRNRCSEFLGIPEDMLFRAAPVFAVST